MKYSEKLAHAHQASISIPFLLLLVLASLVLMSWYHVQKTNYLQHEFLQDSYRLKIMIELSNLKIQEKLRIEENQIHYPSSISFNCGDVQVTWDEQQSCFHLKAELKNHSFREDAVYIRLQDIEK